MKITVDVWRQSGPESSGAFDTYQIDDATVEMSLLELLDRLNDQLVESGNEPIAFDSDCREGICGSCGITVDDLPHGPVANTPTCRQHLRSFSDGDRIKLEPFRSAAFPVVRDLVVDRSALDRVLEAVDTFRSMQEPRRTQTVSRSRIKVPKLHWTSPRASAAALAWQPARMVPRTSSPGPNLPTCLSSRRAATNVASGPERCRTRWRPISGRARPTVNVRRCVPRRYR